MNEGHRDLTVTELTTRLQEQMARRTQETGGVPDYRAGDRLLEITIKFCGKWMENPTDFKLFGYRFDEPEGGLTLGGTE